MNETTQPNNGDKGQEEKSNLVAYRLPANVIPIYEDIAKQLHAQGHIKRPDITALAKFSLNWFASSYIHTQQLMTQQAAAMVGERGL